MCVFQLFIRTGQRIYADQARAGTAELLDQFQPELVRALMHYTIRDDGKRVAKSGFPPVHFSSIHDGFSLIGFGDPGRMIIQDVTAPLVNAWQRHLNRPVILSNREVETAIEWRPYKLQYRIPRLVVQKKPRHRDKLCEESTGKPFIEALLTRSIRTQAEFLGLVVPDSLEIKFQDSGSSFAARLGHGGAALAGLRDARFEANVSLNGLWSFGFIPSKGYGLMDANAARGGERALLQ